MYYITLIFKLPLRVFFLLCVFSLDLGCCLKLHKCIWLDSCLSDLCVSQNDVAGTNISSIVWNIFVRKERLESFSSKNIFYNIIPLNKLRKSVLVTRCYKFQILTSLHKIFCINSFCCPVLTQFWDGWINSSMLA